MFTPFFLPFDGMKRDPKSRMWKRVSVWLLLASFVGVGLIPERLHAEREDRGPGVQLQSVSLEHIGTRDRLVVTLNDAKAPFYVHNGGRGSKHLELRGIRVSRGVRSLIEGKDGAIVERVSIKKRDNGTVSIQVAHHVDAHATAVREGQRLVWIFRRASSATRRPKAVTVAREDLGQDEDNSYTAPSVAGFSDGIPKQVRSIGSRTGYRGRRVDLDFKDADIHNILRLIADVGSVNIVTADNVSGTVTIRMRNVPWDEALDVILQAKNLGMVRRSNLIRVAPIEMLEKEREAAVARIKLEQQLAPIETRLVPVSYAKADDLNPRVRELLSGRGTVSVDARTNTLIVRDVLASLDDVEELVRTLDTQTPQVLIEARIVEASSQYARDVGIQWGGNVSFGSATGNPTGVAFPSSVSAAGGNFDATTPTGGISPFSGTVNPSNFAVNLPAITGTGTGGALGLAFGSLNGAFNLNVRLSAAESSGTVRIVSSPSVLTLDNHEASIGQGTLIPFSQVSAQGVQTAFQEAKLELRVRPHVTSDGSVTMHVKITRDEPDFTRTGPRGDPTILKREAETDLLVDDAETAVIGGIYTRNTGRNKDQIPFFGDIPILGVLFQRRRVSDDRNELLIFITPRIVNREQALKL